MLKKLETKRDVDHAGHLVLLRHLKIDSALLVNLLLDFPLRIWFHVKRTNMLVMEDTLTEHGNTSRLQELLLKNASPTLPSTDQLRLALLNSKTQNAMLRVKVSRSTKLRILKLHADYLTHLLNVKIKSNKNCLTTDLLKLDSLSIKTL